MAWLRPVVKALILALLVAEVIGGILLVMHLRHQNNVAVVGTQPSPKQAWGHRHVNHPADYSFRYPKGWKVSDKKDVSQVRTRDGHALVVFAPLPSQGGAASAGKELVQALKRSYEGFKLVDRSTGRVRGARAILLRAKATNSNHVPINLFAAALPGHGTTYAAVGYWSSVAKPRETGQVRSIVKSLKAPAGGRLSPS